MNKITICIITYCALILLTACSSHFTEGSTPEEAVKSHLSSIQSPVDLGPYRSTHYFNDLAIVLYQRQQPQIFYTWVARRDGQRWYTQKCCESGGGSTNRATPRIEFGETITGIPGIIIVGRRLVPEVGSVEALYASGKTMRVMFQGDDFILYMPQEVNFCELRVYDAENKLLERVDRMGMLLDAPLTNC